MTIIKISKAIVLFLIVLRSLKIYLSKIEVIHINNYLKRRDNFLSKLKEKHPEFEMIGEYVDTQTKIEFKCLIHNILFQCEPNNITRTLACPLCRKEHRILKYLKPLLKNNKRTDIDILQPCLERGGYVECKCNSCGYVWEMRRDHYESGVKCPICSKLKTVAGVNDFATLRPELTKYFKDKNDCCGKSLQDRNKYLLKCPYCSKEFYRSIHSLVTHGFHCPFCDEKISQPNRLIRNLLPLLNVECLEYEYSPDWAGRYRYDAYFEYNGSPYIVEMDGGFHYYTAEKIGFTQDKLIESQLRDKEKDELAKLHNIEVIRINCSNKNFSAICKEVKNSKLSILFDLSKIKWNDLQLYDNFMLNYVCDYYNQFRYHVVRDLSIKLDVCRETVKKYLKRGAELGLCNYDSMVEFNLSKSIPIERIDITTNIITKYNSIKECCKQMNEEGFKISEKMISRRIKNNQPFNNYLFRSLVGQSTVKDNEGGE